MVSILAHIYYRESVKEFSEKISLIKQYVDKVYINLVRENFFEFDGLALPEDIMVTASPNKGKDVGGKLVLLKRYLLENTPSQYLLLLHDKKSPHTPMAGFWSKTLFRIMEPEIIPQIQEAFEKNKNTGIVASATYIRNEWSEKKGAFESTNNILLQQLIKQYHLKLSDRRYVAGTMFWARSSLFENFFSLHDPLNIVSTLEPGNITDTRTGSLAHSWERMLSWICTSQNQTIHGI